ncbi:hypothetical protein PDIDSM_1629 [Penicillium digitatum]|nr:hypothetical protein PDIDSM_1629 [Penicillium digitatum]
MPREEQFASVATAAASTSLSVHTATLQLQLPQLEQRRTSQLHLQKHPGLRRRHPRAH